MTIQGETAYSHFGFATFAEMPEGAGEIIGEQLCARTNG